MLTPGLTLGSALGTRLSSGVIDGAGAVACCVGAAVAFCVGAAVGAGFTLPEHVHMYVSIPPKLSVSKTIGRIKGKSALMIFDRHPEYREKNNRHFWARGYYCETVGNVNEATIKQYIEEQYERDRLEGDSEK